MDSETTLGTTDLSVKPVLRFTPILSIGTTRFTYAAGNRFLEGHSAAQPTSSEGCCRAQGEGAGE
jgi:hypothetical protein